MKILSCTILTKSIKFRYKQVQPYSNEGNKIKPPWKILFFGTDEFSKYSLTSLFSAFQKGNFVKKLEVVTTIKTQANAVQKFAEENKVSLHNWPPRIELNEFDIGIVSSFGHLIPERMIEKFPLGMINVHASLLPRWRGAAPIIYSIAYGDKETGVTIMRIKPKHFDIGEIIKQGNVEITRDMKMPELHYKLGKLGANLLMDCLANLDEYLQKAKPQPKEGVTLAPKITPSFCQIRWSEMSSKQIYDLERSLIGFSHVTSSWKGIPVKLINIKTSTNEQIAKQHIDKPPGYAIYNKIDKMLYIKCKYDSWITVGEIGVLGKRTMKAVDFNNGFIKKETINERYFK